MLRKKIEAQTDRVLTARVDAQAAQKVRGYLWFLNRRRDIVCIMGVFSPTCTYIERFRIAQVADAAAERLAAEERDKDLLCQELNLLVRLAPCPDPHP